MRNLAAITILAGVMTGGLQAAQTIGTVTVNPTSIVAGGATTVVVTAQGNDPSLITNSVNLQQRDAQGNFTSILGTLHDDGVNGDAIGGDHVFSISVVLNIPQPGSIIFKVSAAFRGSPFRAPSAGIGGTITNTANSG